MAAETGRGHPRSVCDDRTGYRRYRTVRENWWPAETIAAAGAVAACEGHRPEADRRWAGHACGDAGPGRIHLRGPVAAVRPRSPAAPVPVPAAARL